MAKLVVLAFMIAGFLAGCRSTPYMCHETRLATNPKPIYPAESIRLGEHGKTKLRVFINHLGYPEEVKLHQSSGFEKLDESAIEAIKTWCFRPATASGKTVGEWVIVPVEFLLNQPPPELSETSNESLDKPEEKPAAAQPITELGTADTAAMVHGEIVERVRLYPHRKKIGKRIEGSHFALYIEDWHIKTERIANLNYPCEARGMYDSLVMTVSIRKDGTIEKVVINRPSKYPVLNEAAEKIVRLGEPYTPFPPEIGRNTDILDITRTWEFTNDFQGSRPASE